MWNCEWPIDEDWDITLGKPYRIALITDPQIIDEYSYGRHGILQWCSETFPDFYMQKNWKNLQRQLNPDAIFVLGDLMDGGREWDDNKWSKEADRYRQLFTPINLMKTPIYYLAGNHDIGFGNKIVPMAYARFRKLYGKTNYVVSLGNHTIVVVDTVTLSGDNEALKTEATNLIESLSKEEAKPPRILMTHVPLYRPPQTDCGPLRQNNRYIEQGAGYQYQNLVEESLTRFILNGVKPKLIFSGDDHDYCEVQHPVGENDNSESYNVTEVTVNSFSFAMGIPKPGFALLTLYNPTEAIQSKKSTSSTFSYSQCLLPNQLSIYFKYIYLALGTLFFIFIQTLFRFRRMRTIQLPVTRQFRRKQSGILQNSMFWKVFFRQFGWVVVWGVVTFLS
ncbi:4092_t:CDS:2 [Ambispora gerdemannii]|uniref:4092_t:CDS:1 n=1 Tax=Ambispora gerdemannii TaxID=144530 RepID=A0A9N9A9F5_9GLOM|nr:4092_t:CDS:2 [Ambispora gerdemannii]